MPDSSPDGEAIPQSRRAAREAAARRASTGATPAQAAASPPAAAPPATWETLVSGPTPVSGSDSPPSPAHAVPAGDGSAPGEGFQPVPLRTPRPADPVGAEGSSSDDDPWIFAGAGVGPAMPYSRAANGTAAAGAAPSAARSAAPRGDEPAADFASGTLEELFSGSTSTEDIGDVPPAKNRRRRRAAGWIALGVILAILGGVAAGGLWVWNTYEDNIREVMGWEEPKDYEAGLANGEAFVTIASGDTGSPISQSLYDAGVTKTPDAFYDYLIESGQNPNFQPGVFKLQKQMTSEAALAALLDPANKQEFTAQIPEGFTVDGTLERLAEGTGLPLDQLQAAAADPAAYGVQADSLEGWLFPATYTFDPSVTPQSAIQTLVDRTVQSLDEAGVPPEDRQRILTIASIIQREARFEQDMQKVSTVIQNRLDPSNQETFGKLQMDSTAQYGYGEMHDGTVSSSEEALNDPNPWNTYVHTGLPVGPIANPGDVAIDAAMHPAEGPWLYFVTVNMNTGETVFTETYREHLRYVEQWQQWCADNPDSGC
jgi:UPF0755 protein